MEFGTINDMTGFANGDKFTSAEQVHEYFTMENLRFMFSGEVANGIDTVILRDWANAVVARREHCAF